MKLEVNEMCFACGQKNPIGLRLEFRFEGDDYATTFRVRPEYQGWTGIVHGGLLTTALDETMARLLWAKGLNAITARLEARFRQPLAVGETVGIRARITRQRPPVVETTAEARLTDGTLVAEAKAVSMQT